MRCTTCDAEIQPGMMFCPNCGTRAMATAPAPAATPLSQPYDEPTAPQWQSPSAPQWMTGTAYVQPVAVPNSTAAVVSLIFGILSWFALPIIGAIVAVVAGHRARAEIRSSNGAIGGSTMATAGLILGYLHFALVAVAICAIGGLILLGVFGAAIS